jgi:hypothetical protein
VANAESVNLSIWQSWYTEDRALSASIGADGRMVVIASGVVHYLYPFPVKQASDGHLYR